MAAVLPAEESDYFRPNTSLRRSHSHTQFASPSTSYHAPIAKSPATPTSTHPASYQPSESSSTSSSPRTIHAESADLSYASTPATAFSVLSDYEESLSIDDAPEDHFSFPSYAQEKFLLQPGYHQDDGLPPPPSPQGGDPAADSITPDNVDAEGPDTPDCSEHAEDDTAVVSRPSRQVDYLSHEWKEEDIWSSWRYVVSRRGEFSNSARLENASWRTWMKAKNNLRTISPETLNWLKDCDVTWLYGPLQTGPKKVNPTHTEPSSQVLSKSDSLVNLNKKPILKKRSMSEMMLQRSLSTASLLKQAAAAVQAQETRSSLRPGLARSNTDYTAFAFSARRSSHGTSSSVDPSVDSSSLASPSVERRHIHFNEQVEQCIAVEVKGDDDDDVEHDWYGKDSDSDDGFMMKRTRTKKRKPLRRRGTKKSSNADGKIIAMLPSTTLKYREDTPEPQETAMKHSTGNLRNSLLSPSPSDETLRPSKESTKFYFGEEDDTHIEDSLLNSKPGWRSPPFEGPSGGPHRSASSGSLTEEPMGMRRTESGMLMPCEEAEAATSGPGEGIFGRVVDTVNTARDIAHVIWNVGWRK